MTMTTSEGRAAVGARIVLPGHDDTVARVDVHEVSFGARVTRTMLMAAVWGTITTATFLITMFDPFMTSLPALVGTMAVYRGWKGRFQVRSFRGGCPRCGADITLKPNSRVSAPHPLVCYACHHEPQLVFVRG
ncbi:MAG TPA: hypothetical protein VFJ82_14490 [Longimicrobium sp.]|nr:hypothetical protein [Longimicrobium sp.]